VIADRKTAALVTFSRLCRKSVVSFGLEPSCISYFFAILKMV